MGADGPPSYDPGYYVRLCRMMGHHRVKGEAHCIRCGRGVLWIRGPIWTQRPGQTVNVRTA